MSKEPMSEFGLPRWDLREKAFRKYEKYIAISLKRSLLVHPFLPAEPQGGTGSRFPGSMNAHTFICRFKDAILGFKRHNYVSPLFDKSAMFEHIVPIENADGSVLLSNRTADRYRIAQGLGDAFNKEKIKSFLIDLASKETNFTETHTIPYYSSDQLAWLLSMDIESPGGLNVSIVDKGNGFVEVF